VAGAGSIDLPSHRDLARRRAGPWVRRAIIALFAAWAIIVLTGLIGQRPKHQLATAPAASLDLSSPSRLRGGLYFQTRIIVRTTRQLQNPRLILDKGLLEGITINTIEPQANQELSRRDSLVLTYNQLAAGDKLTVWIEAQVNPTTVGRRLQSVSLDDGTTQIARITRHTTFFP
jgi:hypothetical protein